MVCQKIPKELFPYYSHRSEITYHEGILLKNQWIIAPTTLHSEMKSIIRERHFGLKNSKKRARLALFWRLINSETEDMIKNCPTCLTFRNRQPSEPAIKHPVPHEPWNKIATDLFRLYGHYYLLVINYNSKTLLSKISKVRSPLPLLISVRRYFCNMVFLRN